MGLKKNIEGMIEKISEYESKVSQLNRETTRIKSEYARFKENLQEVITRDFAKYLSEHPEIPKETFACYVYPYEYPSKYSNHFHVQIKIGERSGEREEMFETITWEEPINVSKKFKDFTDANKPLEIIVLRYFKLAGTKGYY